MATLRRLSPAEISDTNGWVPCDPAGDETGDVPGIVICFRRTPEPRRRWLPAKGKPLALVLTRPPEPRRHWWLRGNAREYRLYVQADAMIGPFGGPWLDGPLRLSYPDGAEGYQVAVADMAVPSVRLDPTA